MLITKFKHINLPSGTIRVSITNTCNMNCFYCHNEGQNKKEIKTLSFCDFKKIIDTAIPFGLCGITFSGGEPFLNKELNKMIMYCHSKGLRKIDICTNGILIKENLEALKISKAINIVVGVDISNKDKISKKSSTGKNFSYIEDNLNLLKKERINFSVNSVYDGSNLNEIIDMCDYCNERRIDIRIIEMNTLKHITKSKLTPSFKKCIDEITKRFKLEIGHIEPIKNLYGITENNSKIYFYHSSCHSRDCFNCYSRWTLRISANGEAIPCYARNFKINLLSLDKTERYNSFLQAICNMGIPPEKQDNFKDGF